MVWLIRYEVKRLFFSKQWVAAASVLVAYAAHTLYERTLTGAYGTAPYSAWSFLSFLLSVRPIVVTFLVLCAGRFYAKRELAADVLFGACPAAAPKRCAAKLAAILVLLCLLACIVSLLYIVCMVAIFQVNTAWMCGVMAALVLVLPQLFLLGACLWIGRIHPYVLYAAIAVLLFASYSQLPMPAWFDLTGRSFLAFSASLTLHRGVLPFVYPPAYLWSQLAMCLAGLLLLAGYCRSTAQGKAQ